MAFLNDLDLPSCAATLVAIVVCFSVTFLNLRDWRNHWRIEVDERTTIIMMCSIVFLIGAINSYSPNANAPRKSVEGTARFVAEVRGKGSYHKYICATSCQLTGGYALDLRDEASNFVRIGSSYVFTYLEKPVGGALGGISLRVIATSNPDSGDVLYRVDLTNHPYRIVVYLFDFALVICSGLLGGFLNRSLRRGHSEESSSDEDEPGDSEGKIPEAGPISLGLDSRDAN
jgi:hypothetical protein